MLLWQMNAGHGLDHLFESPGQSVDGLDGVLHFAVGLFVNLGGCLFRDHIALEDVLGEGGHCPDGVLLVALEYEATVACLIQGIHEPVGSVGGAPRLWREPGTPRRPWTNGL